MTDEVRQKFVPAVQNATAILRLLAERGAPMGATQIARDCGLNVSSAFNILRTLTHEGLASFDPETKTYRSGMGLMELSAPLIGANPADLIRPLMAEIAETHQVMIALWRITPNARIVLVDRFTTERVVQAVIAPDSRLPAFAGAVGRCYAAALGLERDQIRAGYDSVRWQAEPGVDAYLADIAIARESRHAFDHGQLFRGLEIVASVACDTEGTPRLGMSSITISGQHDPGTLRAVGTALAEAAGRIERSVYGTAAARHTPRT